MATEKKVFEKKYKMQVMSKRNEAEEETQLNRCLQMVCIKYTKFTSL